MGPPTHRAPARRGRSWPIAVRPGTPRSWPPARAPDQHCDRRQPPACSQRAPGERRSSSVDPCPRGHGNVEAHMFGGRSGHQAHTGRTAYPGRTSRAQLGGPSRPRSEWSPCTPPAHAGGSRPAHPGTNRDRTRHAGTCVVAQVVRYSVRGHRTAPRNGRRPAARSADWPGARGSETFVRSRDARHWRVLGLGALGLRWLPGTEHVPAPRGAAERRAVSTPS